ncbi:Calx-beta domain-containing protein [Dokdonella sp.]|uniref:Calx-beta domain-containing protein n=1 Tax=Dokdonella sp. TaxID=2291710 RepID=UPI003C3667F9
MNAGNLVRQIALGAALAMLSLTVQAQIIPPQGAEFLFSDELGTAKTADLTAINQAGDFVAVFQHTLPGSSSPLIAGRLMRADGTLVGTTEFVISDDDPNATGFISELPRVSSALDGTFVVVWQRQEGFGVAPSIYARQFTTQSGVAQPIADKFEVVDQAFPGNAQAKHTAPYVSADIGGTFVVGWTATGTLSSGCSPTYNCKPHITGFDAAGQRTIPEQVVLEADDNPFGGVVTGVARVLSSGRFAVLWSHQIDVFTTPNDVCNDQASAPLCIRFFEPDGMPLTSRMRAVDRENSLERGVALAADFSGNFIVAYRRPGAGNLYDLRVRRFDRDGEELTAERTVASAIPYGTEKSLSMSASSLAGNILITTTAGSPTRMVGKWLPTNYDAPDVTVVPYFTVYSAASFFQPQMAAAMALDGNMLVGWHATSSGEQRPFGRRYSAPVEVRINDVATSEGNDRSSAAFTVQISKAHPANAPITLNYQTAEGTATATVDYTPVNGTLTFSGPTQLFQPLVVPVIDDNSIEEDETYLVQLRNPTNSVITRGTGIGTILNDDTGGVLLVGNTQIAEGDSGSRPLNFQVSLSEPQGIAATVSYVTVDESAIAGSDYRATFGTLTIPAGFTSAFASVDVFGDTAFETDESFRLMLFDPVASTVGPAVGSNAGRGTILSDDLCPLVPTISPDNANYPVPGGTGDITVTDSANCGWMASTDTPWLSIVSSPNCPVGSPPDCQQGGIGDGMVSYAVEESMSVNQRIGDLSVADFTATITQDGIQCNFTLAPDSAAYPSSGGQGSFDVTATDPVCEWTAVSQEPWLIITESPNCIAGSPTSCVQGGTGSGTISYLMDINENVDRSGGIVAASNLFSVDQAGFFFDDFDNGQLSPLWDYSDIGLWSESNSRLVGNTIAGGFARAIARPAFAGCIVCTISAKIRFDQFAQGRARLFGWYLDPGTMVELEVDEFANEWRLRQWVGGSMVDSVILPLSTLVSRDYTAELEYDGTDIRLSIDGNLLGVLTPAPGNTPDGTVGFEVESEAVSFDLIKVVTVTGGEATPGLIFRDGFDSTP